MCIYDLDTALIYDLRVFKTVIAYFSKLFYTLRTGHVLTQGITQVVITWNKTKRVFIIIKIMLCFFWTVGNDTFTKSGMNKWLNKWQKCNDKVEILANYKIKLSIKLCVSHAYYTFMLNTNYK